MSIIVSSGFRGVVGGTVIGTDFVTVTVEVCGHGRSHPKDVVLTKQQYEAVALSLVRLQERFDIARNSQELCVVCTEAVEVLDKYGLLPEGMSLLQAQRLVRGSYLRSLNHEFGMIQRSWWEDHHSSDGMTVNRKNMLCVLFATATKLSNYSEEPVILPVGVLLFLGLVPTLLASLVGLQDLGERLAEFGLFLWMSNPFRWFNFVWVDGYEIEVRSIGLLGRVHETFTERGLFTGFTGLMLSPFHNKTVFLGGAFGVFDLS